MSGKLTDGFREIIELRWSELVAREDDLNQSNFSSIITALVRACQKGNLRAIQTALDRLDGKVALEIEVEYPKFYFTYPMAETALELPAGDAPTDEVHSPDTTSSVEDSADDDLPTGSLRAVLERMLDSPKQVVANILAAAEAQDRGEDTMGNPFVKSVIVAGLMSLVHGGKISAVFEVFDQIDGKVAEKIKVLGNDVYITSYSAVAPAGAIKNSEGVYQLEADNITNAWTTRLEREHNGKKGR